MNPYNLFTLNMFGLGLTICVNLFSVCTSVIVGGSDDFSEEESRYNGHMSICFLEVQVVDLVCGFVCSSFSNVV